VLDSTSRTSVATVISGNTTLFCSFKSSCERILLFNAVNLYNVHYST